MDIKQIAEKAGVSIATVSRAINQPHLVRPSTREKVLKIVREMNYAPNPIAQGLLTGRTNTIALVVPTLRNPYFGQLAEGAESVLAGNGYNLTISSSYESISRQESIIENILKRRVDGLILAGSGAFQEGYEKALNKIKIPIAAIEYIPGQDTFNCIYVDDITGVRMAIEHLIHQGHKRIGVIPGNPKMLVTIRRLKAIKNILAEYDLELDKKLICHGSYDSLESGRLAMTEILAAEKVPTAVFAFNDIMAIGAMKCAQDRGLKIPEDVAIVGFDDIPMSEYTTPGLTTLRAPNFQIGKTAATILLEQINNPTAPIRKVLLPVELVLRGSC
ncbi:LacI family DNA-binding transcriptional regulator [Zhaonella formicivorans]|uniref:LacI family DNA-binding transcriptional regulator n=1 Tax=Zhaonella formicivorans TaxID=2528593 RepID=UPI0010DBF917|nr:LacI family DNA-binding transcriptional regulator [Zhaonella formicivorans]